MLYIKKLEIENVRCFGKKQSIDFAINEKIAQWNVILGDNGTGKTTLLRSIVSLLPTPQSFLERRSHLDTQYDLSINNGWRNAWDLKRKDGESDSNLILTISECDKPFIDQGIEMGLTYNFNHRTNSSFRNQLLEQGKFDASLLSPIYCFAYGANRKMAEKSLSNDNLTNTSETLFRDEALLQNSSEYFLRLDYETAKSRKGSEELQRVKELLLKVLPNGVEDIQVAKTGRLQREVQVKTSFGWINLNELSLGYKTTIAWLIDFATKMIYYHEKSENPFNESAILVLDEIDLHMHPAWQKEIIKYLTDIFPKTQFIVTAHSPLIAQTALDSNLILLKRSGDHVRVINEPNIINSWRIDQVLTSDLFGLKDTRNSKVEKALKQRRSLLLKEKLNDNEKKELKRLEQKIDEIPVAETQEYIKAMNIVLKASKKSV